MREMWATRPHRRADDRKIGGVAAAIGRRYAIDPVLVRVAFVVVTLFGGAGIVAYLLGWLLLPAEGDQVSAAEGLLGRGHSSMSVGLTVVLAIALIPAAGMVLDGDAYGLLGLAAAGAAFFLLHRSRAALGQLPGTAGAPASGDTPSASTPGTGPAGTGAGSNGSGAGPGPEPGTETAGNTETAGSSETNPAPTESPSPTESGRGAVSGLSAPRPTPPSWDPLSAAPFAWGLPEPAQVPPPAPVPARGPRSKVTPITLGLALLVGGITSALWPELSLTHIAALVLGVVGLGLVVGALLRGGRGLIGFALPLALLVWVLQAVPVSGFRVGEGAWTPVTPAQVQQRYDVTMGNIALDLTRLRIPDGQTVRTAVGVGVGGAQVTLPRNVDAQVVCRAPVGTVDCLGVPSSGIPAEVTESGQGADGPGGGTLILDVRAGVGNVAVLRAP